MLWSALEVEGMKGGYWGVALAMWRVEEVVGWGWRTLARWRFSEVEGWKYRGLGRGWWMKGVGWGMGSWRVGIGGERVGGRGDVECRGRKVEVDRIIKVESGVE